MTIGERIKNRRNELGLTADEVAEQLDKSRATVYRYESGEIEKMPTTVLEPLAEVLKTTPAYLMGWEEVEQAPPVSKENHTEVILSAHETIKFNEFINNRRKELNMSIDELVLKSGIPKGTLSKITAGINTNPTLSTVEALCRALNCSINDAVGFVTESEDVNPTEREMIKKYRVLDKHGKEIVDYILDKEYERVSDMDNSVEDEYELVSQTNCIVLTMYEDAVSAGTGEPLNDCRSIEVTIDDTPLNNSADYILRVSGDSMEPTYSDGDKVLVEETSTIEFGEIGVFIKNGEGYIKECREDGLYSHNEKYPVIKVNDSDDFRVAGKVIGKV